tara:strand:+ start:269 stop:457 length:189 start_codon:yes stop_codon:yes gene_type:complete
MQNIDSIYLVDYSGGVIATIISIIVAFAIIGGLLFYVKKRRRNKKGMVHNKPKKNDHPENLK